MHRQLIIIGASCALLAVVLGAFAAHGLKATLGDYEKGIWQTAVDYQFYHALGLILLGLVGQVFRMPVTGPGLLMFTGILLFSGSLYVLSLSGIRSLGMITPIGGSCFIIAWLWLIIRFARHPSPVTE